VINALGFVVLGLLTRMLGPDGFGQYSTVYAFLFFVAIVADMGLGTLATREISHDGADEARILGQFFTLRLCLVFGASILGIIAVFFFPYPFVVKVGVIVASAAIVAQSLVQVLMGTFQKHLRIFVVAVGDVVTRLIQLAGLVILFWRGIGLLVPVLVVNIAAESVHLWYMIIFARRIVPFTISVDIDYWKRTLKNALPIALSLVFTLLYFKIDTIMLSIMRPPADVGVYSVAYKVLEVIIFFPAMYVGLIMPLLSRHSKEPDEFKAVFQKTFRILALGAVLSILGLLIFSNPIISLIGGNEFVDSAMVLRILSLAAGLIFLGNLGGNAIIALNIQKQGMWIYAVGAVFNIAANLVFIPKYGYLAAAWTTVATELLVTVWMFWLIRRKLIVSSG